MKIIIIFLALFLTACGGNKSGVTGSVTMDGNIKNEALVWHTYLPALFKSAFAVSDRSNRSTLIPVNPQRLNDVNLSTGIVIDTDLNNGQNIAISNYRIDIAVEHKAFLTKEAWTCDVCYPISGGMDCENLYDIKGNSMFENEPDPLLPNCAAGTGSPALCVTQFNNDPDCSNPSYVANYQESGNGLWEATISNISAAALTRTLNSVGMQDSGMDIGSNRYGRFTVYNDRSVQILRQDYVFNVVK